MKQTTLTPVKKTKKRINTKVKGDRNQLKARDWLLEQGFYFYFSPPKTRFSKDFYGLFDFMMFDAGGTIWFIQVTSNAWHSEKIPEIAHFTKGKSVCAMVINCKDGGEILARYFYNGEERGETTDKRKAV